MHGRSCQWTVVDIGGVRMNLFENMEPVDPFEPLAVRMRPRSLDHFFGQEQVVGPGTFLRSMIEEDKVIWTIGNREDYVS